jgi:acetyl-CoA synthetase
VFFGEVVPDYPDAGNFWKLIQDMGVTIFYTAPTAIRMFMKLGEEWPDKYDLSSSGSSDPSASP